MSKFDFIFKDGDKMLDLCDELEQVLNRYGLTLISFIDGKFVEGEDNFTGNIVAFLIQRKERMTPMIELIDKKALIEHLNTTYYRDVIEEIKKFTVFMKVDDDILERIEERTTCSMEIVVDGNQNTNGGNEQ